jgi:hypothetical protein
MFFVLPLNGNAQNDEDQLKFLEDMEYWNDSTDYDAALVRIDDLLKSDTSNVDFIRT